jgi:hypothetical protein
LAKAKDLAKAKGQMNYSKNYQRSFQCNKSMFQKMLYM